MSTSVTVGGRDVAREAGSVERGDSRGGRGGGDRLGVVITPESMSDYDEGRRSNLFLPEMNNTLNHQQQLTGTMAAHAIN